MRRHARLIAGLALCMASALLMVTGVVSEEIGLVAGTLGILLVAAASGARRRTGEDETS